MNGFFIVVGRWVCLVGLVVATWGCQQESSNKATTINPELAEPSATPQFRTELDGKTILRDLVSRYATANSYQDKAVLYLSYRLDGQSIQEPQRWETKWDRSGKMSSRIFNGTLQGDGELLSCYIFDIDTANLNDQQLLIPYDQQLPLRQLFRDSIAVHFLGGYSELPMDETDLISAPKLIPPTISLLTNQLRNGWLQDPLQVERLPDQTVGEKPCYVVRCLSGGMTSDVWIDRETNLLVQMSMPLKLLVGEVVTSPEITEVVLLAKFHDAVIDQQINSEEFALTSRPDSTPVRKFVALPDTLPSEMIGQTAPKFSFVTSQGAPVRHLDFDGKVTTLLWLAGRTSYSAVGKLDQLASKFPADKFLFGSVYSDSDLRNPETGSSIVVEELAEAKLNHSSLYYDSELSASTALRVKVVPSVVVLDGDSRIQYAQSLSNKNWLTDVEAAIGRVSKGENLAAEMQDEYQRYLASYDQQLATVDARNLLKIPETGAPSNHPGGWPTAFNQPRNLLVRPVRRWVNSEFKRAGNILVLDETSSRDASGPAPRILVFDGWRTVAELDVRGATISRFELVLPEGAAVNRIRVGNDANGDRLYAVFSALGERIYLFDQSWKSVGVYPPILPNESSAMQIRDCQLTDLNSDGRSELVVAFDGDRGIELVDPKVLKGERIAIAQATSIVSLDGDLVLTGDGKVATLKTGLKNVEETELDFRRICSNAGNQLCGIGVTQNGRWNAVGFNSKLTRSWTLSIGSQFFESEIESISSRQLPTGKLIWGFADAENTIQLVSGDGKWLGDFISDSPLSGIAFANEGPELRMIVSSQAGVECWEMKLNQSPMRPVSTQK